jgi:hypothetical protein
MANLRRRITWQTESLFAENHEAFFNNIDQKPTSPLAFSPPRSHAPEQYRFDCLGNCDVDVEANGSQCRAIVEWGNPFRYPRSNRLQISSRKFAV